MYFNPEGLREELQEVAAAYMEAVNARDLDRAVLVYTEDCAMMAPGMDVAHGHDGEVECDSCACDVTFALEVLEVYITNGSVYVRMSSRKQLTFS